jgi:hypothetical protein
VTSKQAADIERYRAALEQIARYKHTPRAYRHMKFEQLVKIAEAALTDSAE